MIGIGAADPKARRSPFTAGSDLEPRPEAIRGQIVDVALDEPELSRGSRVDAGNPPESARAYADYQVAEPRQMCSLPHIADMIRAALEFVGGSASRPANSLPSPLPQARAGTLWAMGSALDHTHEERRCEA